MQVGEVVFGGVGSGLYGMLAYAIIAVLGGAGCPAIPARAPHECSRDTEITICLRWSKPGDLVDPHQESHGEQRRAADDLLRSLREAVGPKLNIFADPRIIKNLMEDLMLASARSKTQAA